MRLAHAASLSLVLVACGDPSSVQAPLESPSIRSIGEVPPPCSDCVLGPITLDESNARKLEFTTQFPAIPGDYRIAITPHGEPGAILELQLNGENLPPFKSQKTPISGAAFIDVRLDAINQIRARLFGRPGFFTIEIPRPLPLGACKATPLFTHPTTPIDQLRAIVPLGNLNPPEHVIPTPHIYMWPVSAGTPGRVPIHAPAFSRVVAIGVDEEGGDYYAYLTPCADARVYLIHIKEFAPRLAGLAAAPFGGFRVGPGFFKLVLVDLAAGELVGWADRERGPYDVGFVDMRRPPLGFANPDRYFVPPEIIPPGVPAELVEVTAGNRIRQYCIIDEYVPAVKAQLESLLGSFDGVARRKTAPLCGSQMQDVPGTAQGNWFTPTGGGIPERGRIALAHDNVNPSQPVFSIGNDMPGWPAGRWLFTPLPTGMVNREFDAVVPGGTYCYDGVTAGPADAGRVLVEVFGEDGGTSNRLRIERQAGSSCGAGPWAFTGAVGVFQR